MRVGVLTYGLDREHTGIGRYTLELLQALGNLALQHEIVLLTTEDVDTFGLWQQFEHHALPLCRRLPLLQTVGSALIPAAARRHKLDVIHDPIGVAPLLLTTSYCSTVVTVHDAIPWSFPGVSSTLDTLIYRRWLPYMLPRVDHVITVSRSSQADIERYLGVPGSKISVIPEGVNPSYRPCSAERITQVRARYSLPARYLLYVGSAEERKNLRRLLQAYALLRRRGVRQPLVIVGPRHERDGAQLAVIADLGLQQHVVVTGYVRGADLPAIYCGADLFVFPSLYEGFGLPPLEAMACGTPVVSSNTASLPEVIGAAALTVDPYDTDALAGAMERVLVDESLRATLLERGRARAAHYTWQRTASITMSLYEDVFSRTLRTGRRQPKIPSVNTIEDL